MRKALVVIDMQNDFVTGVFKNEAAIKIVPNVVDKVKTALEEGKTIFFTRDTHDENYADTEEGRNLPIPHCIKNSKGWALIPELKFAFDTEYLKTLKNGHTVYVIDKSAFGSDELGRKMGFIGYDVVEFIGVCTDICVISNAVVVKTFIPNAHIIVDASCCAGTTEQRHKTAIEAMKVLQIEVRGE